MKDFKETIIIAMGGSLLVPEKIDVNFIKELKYMAKDLVEQGYQIALVVGGGKTCRFYQSAARGFDNVTDVDLDWIGIKTIRLNCELLLRVFSDLNVHPDVIERWEDAENVSSDIIIVGAYKPGCSSDTDAVELARTLGAHRIINFSNVSHVYSEDPRINPEAEKFDELSWSEYRALIPKDWTPGLSAPFDPVASRLGEENNITVVILGASLENLKNYLENKEFEGTVIS